jgi:hypothetical protein
LILGFKRFRNASVTISGIELMHRFGIGGGVTSRWQAVPAWRHGINENSAREGNERTKAAVNRIVGDFLYGLTARHDARPVLGRVIYGRNVRARAGAASHPKTAC